MILLEQFDGFFCHVLLARVPPRCVSLCRSPEMIFHGHPSPRAENAKINVTDEPYFGTQIVCNYLPFSKAAKGAQGGPQQYATFERKHSPTEK